MVDTATDTPTDTGDDTDTATRSFPQSRFAPPPGATEILLVRHGESAAHVEGESFDLVDGHGDPPLSPAGWEQAKLAAQRLVDTGERIAAVYVTTLQRTHQTAEPLLEYLEMQATVIADLREVFLGEWEGGEFRRRIADGDPIAPGTQIATITGSARGVLRGERVALNLASFLAANRRTSSRTGSAAGSSASLRIIPTSWWWRWSTAA